MSYDVLNMINNVNRYFIVFITLVLFLSFCHCNFEAPEWLVAHEILHRLDD